ncbi:MAG TPA: hypothetical protein VGK57_06105, partial [Candidatus Binatia bacterium]
MDLFPRNLRRNTKPSQSDAFKTNLIAELCYPQFAAGSVFVGGTDRELLGGVRRVLIIVASASESDSRRVFSAAAKPFYGRSSQQQVRA